MANADIRITLNGGDLLPGGLMRFDPGGAMSGTVQVSSPDNINCKSVVMRLAWHTEGRGDRDSGEVAQVPIHTGALSANQPVSQNFNLILPKQPWSFAGHYINIVWEIKVTIDIAFSPDINGSQVFVLAPRL
jgi:hypothetical protein